MNWFTGSKYVAAAALLFTIGMAGCKSAQEKANEQAITQAKQQAAATGTAQQVVATDKDGTTITTIVQPPLPGQTTQQITTTRATSTISGGNTTRSTTTTTSLAPAARLPLQSANGPVVGPVSGEANGPANANLSGVPNANGGAPQQAGANGPVITPIAVHVPRGTTLAVRINQRISVKTSRSGDRFSGEVVNPITSEGSDRVAIPRGTQVGGVVEEAHKRGRFKGRSVLGLRLTSMTLNGQNYSLDTSDNVRTKKGKGKRSAAFIGGGAGLGALVGGLTGGGLGLAVGGLAGAGAGTAVAGFTGNRDLDIPSESVINFRLAEDLVLHPR